MRSDAWDSVSMMLLVGGVLASLAVGFHCQHHTVPRDPIAEGLYLVPRDVGEGLRFRLEDTDGLQAATPLLVEAPRRETIDALCAANQSPHVDMSSVDAEWRRAWGALTSMPRLVHCSYALAPDAVAAVDRAVLVVSCDSDCDGHRDTVRTVYKRIDGEL